MDKEPSPAQDGCQRMSIAQRFERVFTKVSHERRHISGFSFIDIELTERYNNNCIHCYVNRPADDHQAQEEEVTGVWLQNLLEEAVASGTTHIRFTGGEPLLRHDFVAIYGYACRLGLSVSVATNGTLITGDIANTFREYPPGRLGVSLYGWDQSSYERITRTEGAFEKSKKGLEILRDYGIPFYVKVPPIRELPANLEKARLFSRAFNATFVSNHAWYLMLRTRREKHLSAMIRRIRLSPVEVAKCMAGARKGLRIDRRKLERV
jgi:MoaA/NifB/PqqE/SkfB family radical SAM enzyme